MPKNKKQSDAERFLRYQSVVDVLLSKNAFSKADIYENLQNETKSFIGRILSELAGDGYLRKDGPKSMSVYTWTSKQETFNSGQWIDRRVFTATVKRSPTSDRPRERLLRLGTEELKTSELLAILIRSGLQGESALLAGEKLAAHFGEDLQKLSLKARGELKQISKAIGETAYCQIMAALELGKRLTHQMRADPEPAPKIASTADALAYCKEHFQRLAQEASREEFHVVLLDEKHRIIKTERITVGLLNESLAHPREVLKPAIRESAAAIILVHNHPNGDPTPSEDDKTITKELKTAADTLGIRILDHVILARETILSMVDERLL